MTSKTKEIKPEEFVREYIKKFRGDYKGVNPQIPPKGQKHNLIELMNKFYADTPAVMDAKATVATTGKEYFKSSAVIQLMIQADKLAMRPLRYSNGKGGVILYLPEDKPTRKVDVSKTEIAKMLGF